MRMLIGSGMDTQPMSFGLLFLFYFTEQAIELPQLIVSCLEVFILETLGVVGLNVLLLVHHGPTLVRNHMPRALIDSTELRFFSHLNLGGDLVIIKEKRQEYEIKVIIVVEDEWHTSNISPQIELLT